MCSEHALSLIQSLHSKKTAIMCSSIGRAIARFARGPGFESRHSRSMFFCYIGDPDVMSRLCYDRTTNFRMHCMFLSHSVLHQGDLCSGFHLHTICVVNTLSHSYRVYIAKRQRSCVAQSVEQSPGLREVLGSNPGTADQCFSAITYCNGV